MSVMPHEEPVCTSSDDPSVALELEAQLRNLPNGFSVRRVLPSLPRKMVGPFIFFDHLGPVLEPAAVGSTSCRTRT